MTCEDARYKLQALTDNELDDKDIAETVSHLESCYACREEYIELLKVQRRLKGISVPQPPAEWFEDMERRIPRKITGFGAKTLFFTSYIVLLGYALFTLFSDAGAPLLIKFGVGGVAGSLVVLLGITIMDRVRESRTDKYKGVMK